MKVFGKASFLISILFISYSVFGQQGSENYDYRIFLTKWELKSSLLERSTGKEISTGHYSTEHWLPAFVPTTVLNALVKDGVYPDPRVGLNNYLIPDISDRFNAEHDLLKYSYMPGHVNPWKDPYWFRTKFEIPREEWGKQVWLNFDGINYRGEVWLNGIRVADSAQMVGMFRRFKYDVTSAVKFEGENYLAVKIYPVDHYGPPGTQLKVFGSNRGPDEELFKDVTLKISGGWDCALPARDRNMGIYQPVYLSFTGPIDIVDPYVVTLLPLPDTSSAKLSITLTLLNVSSDTVSGTLKGAIKLLTEVDMGTYIKRFSGRMPPVRFEKKVVVPARGSLTISLSYKDFPQLIIKDPHLWWPIGYGEQYLHELGLSFENDGKVSAFKSVTFGIREVSSNLHELNGDYGRVFYVNGQRIFCKGGWIQPDMLLDNSRKNLYDQVRLIANANLNLISSEDMPSPPDDLMDACDKYGVMWWEVFYQCWTTVPGTKSAYLPYDHLLAIQNERDIILRYRNHPSLIAWCAENENVPGPDLYLALKSDLAVLDTTRPFLASTAVWWDWKKLTPYIEPDLPVGTTDNGPPDYTWYPLPYYFNVVDNIKDQMFHNELGMDAVPTLSSLKKFISNPGRDTENPLFPLDSVWAEHGAWDGDGYAFRAYYYAIKNLYGFKHGNISSFVHTAQIVNADNYRAMFEAANSRMWDITSGVMIWKLNASYPDFAWEMYDWYLNPNAGYYYVKSACEPLHIQMNANDNTVSVINTYKKQINDLRVRALLYDFNLKLEWEREVEINIRPDCYQEIFSIPLLTKMSPVYFVKLELMDRGGKVLSRNLYWMSSKLPSGWFDISEQSQIKEIHSLLDDGKIHPLFSGLANLVGGNLTLKSKVEESDTEYHVIVKLRNNAKKLSFMNRLAIVRSSDNEEVLPTFWSDNFITLFPGEERTVEATFSKEDLHGSAFRVVIDKE